MQLKHWHEVRGTKEKLNDLQVAAADGDVALVKTNLFRGAKLDVKDTAGRTALMLATINNHYEVVEVLLKAGADMAIRDYQRKTCLDHALEFSRDQIADLLLTFDVSSVSRYQRKHKHLGRGMKLWVDAICINQADPAEKNNQVSQMDKIYAHQNAQFCAAWLGRDDGHALQAASAIDKLFPAAASKALGQSSLIPYRVNPAAAYTILGIEAVTQQEWISLAALYLRQNFQRLWCLQELVLQDRIVMYAGNVDIPFDEFMMVTEQLHILQSKYAVAPSTMFRPNYNHPIESEAHLISELRVRRSLDKASAEQRKSWFDETDRFWRGENKPSQIPLLEMILSSITFKCYDPRDHVYALLGMCKDHPESPEISVDYERPWEELYTIIMRLMLHKLRATAEPSLELVAAIKDSALKASDDLPSWTFDFAAPGVASFWKDHFAAAGDSSPSFDLELSVKGSSRELVVQGQKIDEIKLMAKKRTGAETVSMFRFDEKWPELVLSLPQKYTATGQPRTEVLWRTLCADQPATDDILRAQQDKATAASIDAESPAPDTYAEQFKMQVCAMLLSVAEKQADLALRMRTSRGGILLQALMATQLADDETGEVKSIYGPTEEELSKLRDTYLDGPYYSKEIHTAIAQLQQIHEQDLAAENVSYCATPSLAQVKAFLADPQFRCWRPSADLSSEINPDWLDTEHAQDAQAMDVLPPGQDGFRSVYSRCNGGRRLFTTSKQYLGLGPMSMVEGDEIWILRGSRVPLLLRRLDVDQNDVDNILGRPCYKLIGDLYVHGIMKGEAMDPSVSWQEMALR